MKNGYDIVPKLFIFAKSNIYELCQASGGPWAPDYQFTEELPIRQLTCITIYHITPKINVCDKFEFQLFVLLGDVCFVYINLSITYIAELQTK